ncbi:hypothetical protein [Flavobacterium album]|nr:hypothetical protein [Flavobacterium album]
MKTDYTKLRSLSLYSILGVLGMAVTSCSSYNTASSTDNDGIYGNVPRNEKNEPVYTYNDGNVSQYKDGAVTGQNSNGYSTYFNSLQDQYPVVTDVDGYSSYDNDTIAVAQSYNSNAGWGEDPNNVTVNVYGGNGYGYGGYGWGGYGGWGYPYYGGWGWGLGYGWGGYYGGWGWGLGYGYVGWGLGYGWGGYGGWGGYYGGWGYPYYGGYYGNHYHHYNNNYGYGRSTGYYLGGRNSGVNGRYAQGRRSTTSINNGRSAYSSSRGSSVAGRAPRFTNSNTSRGNNGIVRSRGDVQYNNSGRNSSYSNSSRNSGNNSYTPSRSYSAPSRSGGNFSTPSRSSGGFSGGGRSGGFGGGGGGGSRGGGGGGGRRG